MGTNSYVATRSKKTTRNDNSLQQYLSLTLKSNLHLLIQVHTMKGPGPCTQDSG